MTAGTFHEDQPKRALQDIIADGEASAYEAALIAKMSRDLPDIKRIGVMSSKEELKWQQITVGTMHKEERLQQAIYVPNITMYGPVRNAATLVKVHFPVQIM
jgi:hypothetical protein